MLPPASDGRAAVRSRVVGVIRGWIERHNWIAAIGAAILGVGLALSANNPNGYGVVVLFVGLALMLVSAPILVAARRRKRQAQRTLRMTLKSENDWDRL